MQSGRDHRNEAEPAPGIIALGTHVAALDGLRGVAILLVVVFHFGSMAHPVGLPAKIWVFCTTFGWTGVDLFFVLSGFLITGILLNSKDRPGYFRNFYARRVLRIFPLYYGVLAVMLIALPFFLPHDAPDVSLILQEQGWLWAYSSNVAIALWHGAWIWNAGWLCLGMLWSLAVEEHFYLVWPLLVFLLSRRWLLRLSVAIVAFVPVMRLVARLGHVSVVTVYVLTPFRADSLAMGAALALLVRQPELARSFARRVPWAMIVAIAVVIPMGLWRGYFDHYQAVFQILGYTALIVFYGSIVLATVTAADPSRLHRMLSNPRLTFFGKYSYGAYILHEVLRPAFLRFLPFAAVQRVVGSELLALLAHLAIGLAITFALAVVSFRLYESRFLELKRFFEYQRLPVTPRVAAVGEIGPASPGS